MTECESIKKKIINCIINEYKNIYCMNILLLYY